MGTRLSLELAQQALDARAANDNNVLAGARALGLTRGCMEARLRAAALEGLEPSGQFIPTHGAAIKVERLAPAIDFDHENKDVRVGNRILVIPDAQVKPGHDQSHLLHIGRYIVDQKPDVVVNIGDFADMQSLSSYDKGKLSFEGRRYVDDVDAAKEAMALLMAPIHHYNDNNEVEYLPRLVLTLGNHEERINRAVEDSPELLGKLSVADLGYEDAGWEVFPFLQVVEIYGIEFSHYFTSGAMGRPVSSAAALLRTRQKSAIMGHTQICDIALHQRTQQMAMMVACCYTHDEKYLGPQGNVARRQIVVLNECNKGVFDPMLVSLEYLRKRYA
jgi:hypothetical protein